MFIDLAWTLGAGLGVAGAIMDGRYLAAFVWFGIGVYALGNYLDRKLATR